MNKVKVGDILARPGKPGRIVRHVTYSKSGLLSCVSFSILHCSWTTRCYTVMNYNDLDYLGYLPTGKRVKLTRKIDKAIDYCLKHHDREQQKLDCCDVEGIR